MKFIEKEELGNPGDFVRDLRKTKGLTIRELAKLSGVSYSAISRYETGERIPPVHIFEQLLKAMDSEIIIIK